MSHGTRARSYWLLVSTKPNTGEHGARGAGWRNKCPTSSGSFLSSSGSYRPRLDKMRISLLVVAVLCQIAEGGASLPTAGAKQPHLFLVLADDYGW